LGKKDNERLLADFAAKLGLDHAGALLEFPKYLMIETVSSCNARCAMCTIDQVRRKTRLMEQGLFEKLLAEIRPYAGWIERITIQLDGEPLLDRRLEERIRALKEAGIRFVTFNSNAALMSRERAESILRSGIDEVTFSVDGVVKETFESIRRGLNFESCIANIEEFIAARDCLKAPASVRVRMTVQESNAGEFEDFLKFWSSRLGPRDAAYGKLLHNWAGGLEGYRLTYDPEDRRRLNDSLCLSPWSSLIVLSDGQVPLCCSDYAVRMAMGDAEKDSLREIWRGGPFEEVRRRLLARGRNAVTMCRDCNVWDPLAKVDAASKIEI